MASGNDPDTPQLRITRRQGEPRRNKGMRLNTHVGRVLMPTHEARAFGLLEEEHAAAQKDVCTNQVTDRPHNYGVMSHLIHTGEREMCIVAVGRA